MPLCVAATDPYGGSASAATHAYARARGGLGGQPNGGSGGGLLRAKHKFPIICYVTAALAGYITAASFISVAREEPKK